MTIQQPAISVPTSANSRTELLRQMQNRSVTHGWSAISICNRTRINRLLQQQYISKFNVNSFMPSFVGTVVMNSSDTEFAELAGIILSTPMLSFENASLNQSRARLTMDIVSGSVAHIARPTSYPAKLLSTLEIGPSQGFKLFMDIDLQEVQGSVDQLGRVRLDLSRGTRFSTNLIDDPGMSSRLGAFFQERFQTLPVQSRVYELGLLDMTQVDRFSPAEFIVRTQAAPGGTLLDAETYGDGAVVVFIRTQGDRYTGETPATMPYWIPDDLDPGTGLSKYSATLIVSNRALLHWALASHLEHTIGGVAMQREQSPIGQLNRAYATAGTMHIWGVNATWKNDDETNWHSFSNEDYFNIPFSNALPSKSLNLTIGSDGLIYLNWPAHVMHPFRHRFVKNGTGGGINDRYEVTIDGNMRLGFKASVDPDTGEVLFERQSSSHDIQFKLVGSFDHLRPSDVDGILRREITQRMTQAFARFEKFTLPGINTLPLQNLLFPEGNALELDEAYTPGDLVMFGNVNPRLTTALVSPQFHIMRAGKTQQFSLHAQALAATDIEWSCRSVDVGRTFGVIDAQSGVYTSIAPKDLEKRATRSVITATYTDTASGERRSTSALVLEVAEGTEMAQGVVVSSLSSPQPIQLRASTLGNARLKWTLLDDKLGSLVDNGNTAIYTPPALQPTPFVVQRIEVRNEQENEVSICSVVLVSLGANLEVSPIYQPGVGPGRRVQLAAQRSPSRPRLWSVIAGEGSVDANGLYTAPQTVSGSHTVIQCQILDSDGFVDYEGYSVLHIAPYANFSPWESINKFTLRPMINAPVLYRNGYQQLPVEITIETDPVDGVAAPVTASELAQLRLVTLDHQLIGLISDDGLEDPEGNGAWAVNLADNGYRHYGQVQVATEVLSAQEQKARDELLQSGFRADNESTRSTVRYLHTTSALNLKVAAMILRDEVLPFYSDQFGGVETGNVIEVTPARLPSPVDDNYLVEAVRVRGEGKCEYPDYNIYLKTLDYHQVKLQVSATEIVPFKRFDFESFDTEAELEKGGTSVQWEGEYVEEVVASFLGYLLPAPRGQAKAVFNERFLTEGQLLNSRDDYEVVPDGHEPVSGSFTVVMARVRDLAYRHTSVFKKRPIHVRIRDVDGNLHRLRISFQSPTNRNELRIERDDPVAQ